MLTREEMLEYRSNGIPDDVLQLMCMIGEVVKELDFKPEDGILRLRLKSLLTQTEDLTNHYYKKRQRDFGIHNMKLKRLLDSFPELFKAFGLTRSPSN